MDFITPNGINSKQRIVITYEQPCNKQLGILLRQLDKIKNHLSMLTMCNSEPTTTDNYARSFEGDVIELKRKNDNREKNEIMYLQTVLQGRYGLGKSTLLRYIHSVSDGGKSKLLLAISLVVYCLCNRETTGDKHLLGTCDLIQRPIGRCSRPDFEESPDIVDVTLN